MPAALYVLLGAGLTIGAILGCGSLLLSALRIRLAPEERLPLGFLCGAPVLSGIVFALAAGRLVHKGVVVALALVLIAAAWRLRPRVAGDALPPLPRGARWTFVFLFAPFLFLYVANAMAPEWSPDSYHLGLVSRYYRAHGLVPVTTNMYGSLSQGVELLFLFNWPFGKHSGAALVHLAFLVALAFAMVRYGQRTGHAWPGVAAAIFVFASPVAGADGAAAYNDVALAATLFALFSLLERWRAAPQSGLLIPVGLLAGFGYAIKYTAFLAVPYALAVVLWKARKLKPAILVAACAAVMIAPWMIKNWATLGNPVSPFLNAVFPNPFVHVSFEREWSTFLRSYGVEDRRQIPLEATVRGQKLGGLVGPLFLLAPLALLAVRSAPGRRVLAAALLFTLPYAGNIGTRFLLPSLPFWSLALALALAWRPLLAALAAAHAVLSWPHVLNRYCDPYAWRLAEVPWKAALRLTPEDRWLREKSQGYSIARMIEAHTPADARIFSFSPLMEAYSTRDIIAGYQGAENQVLRDILLTPLIDGFWPKRRYTFAFPAVSVRRIEVVQTERADPDFWNVTELRVYSGGQELERRAEWRLRATPNPFEVQMAFDNSPVTRWRSWQTIEPGMRVEVDFGRDETIDAVSLEMSDDQHKVRMRLNGHTSDGRTLSLAGKPREESNPLPYRLRRAAVEELKLRGIGYILVDDADHGAADFREKPAAWGITEVASTYTGRLYKLD
ncbi:MAG: glycosyltransferase family 39 protein [Bryobacteraceae bacterium]|nr:glycosyltransferase family 39 protein [Bryobacteraceae bacterium]